MCGILSPSSKFIKTLKSKRALSMRVTVQDSKVYGHLCVTDNPEQKMFK